MAYIRSGTGGAGGDSDITLYENQNVGAGKAISCSCHKNDIIVTFGYTSSYSTATSGCEVIATYGNYAKKDPRKVTIIKANQDNIEFTIYGSYNGFSVYTRNGKTINVEVTQLANSTSSISVNKTINANINDVLVFPYIPNNSTTFTISNTVGIADRIINDGSIWTNYHMYTFRATGTSCNIIINRTEYDSIIRLY